MRLLIKNGRLVDAASGTDRVEDILIEDGIIKARGNVCAAKEEELQVIDADGFMVMPGFIDLHVHLRDPGQQWKEDIYSGSEAAAKGGFTTVAAMPDTFPVIDNVQKYAGVLAKADNAAVHIIQACAATIGEEGAELTDFKSMAETGVRLISDEPKTVMNSGTWKRVLMMAARYGLKVFASCEEHNLVNGGCVNDDIISRKEGLPGISSNVENIIVARDILLCAETNMPIHLCHISTKESVEMIRMAKKAGIRITADTNAANIILTSNDRKAMDTLYKVNPPLRTNEDREALLKGLSDGTIDAISSGHTPHRMIEKQTTMVKAPFGISGLETAAALVFTEAVKKKWLTPIQMVEKMSCNPARILRLERRGNLFPGSEADLIIWDPEASYRIDTEKFVSKGKNTPFNGKMVTGEVLMTVCGGNIVYAAQR